MGILNLFKPVMVCNGLEINEICTFLDFKKFFKINTDLEKKNSEIF